MLLLKDKMVLRMKNFIILGVQRRVVFLTGGGGGGWGGEVDTPMHTMNWNYS